MPITYVASSVAETIQDGSLSTITVTLGASASIGDYVVGMVGWSGFGENISTLVDDLGNTYTLQNKVSDTTNSQAGQSFYGRVTVAGTPLITVTFTTARTFRRIIVAAYSGLTATGAADGTVGSWQSAPGINTDAVTSTAITPTVDGDLIVAYHQNTSSSTGHISAGTNFTRRNALEAIIALEDLIQTTVASIAGTFTIAIDHASVTHVAAFKAAPPAPIPASPLVGNLRW